MRMTRKKRQKMQRRQKAKDNLIRIVKKGAGLTAAAMLLWNTFSPSAVEAMPTNGKVVVGGAVINQNGLSMIINQLTNKAAINWHSFSIAANERVSFNQPGINAVMLNRVIGNDPSKIFGQLSSNGTIFLVNPNGVLFAPGAQVNVGGLLATTHSISDNDFMSGNYTFISSNTDGKVINQGTIIAENQGMVTLLAAEAANEGIIVAKKGSVALVSGNQATFDFIGDGRMELVVDESAVKALVENKGLIEVDGGLVLMTASAGKELSSAVVNQSGIIRATSFDGQTGSVQLNSVNGTANISGTIDVSGTATGAKGGLADVFGENINLGGSAQIDASGDAGGGTVRIGGDWQGSSDAPHAQNVTIAKGAVINADAITSGQGGKVVAWSDGTTVFDGSISAKGGQLDGDGGKVETSGHVLKIEEGSVNASAANGQGGEWLLDPINVTIVAGSGGNMSPGTSTINNEVINAALSTGSGTNVKITTGGINEHGTEDGNITVSADITKTNNNTSTLTLDAYNNIEITNNAQIKAEDGKLNVDLNSATSGLGSGTVKLDSGTLIDTNGGFVKIHGGSGDSGYSTFMGSSATPGVDISGSIETSGGSISVYGATTSPHANTGGVSIGGSLDSAGGDITINGLASNTASDAGSSGVLITGTISAGPGTVNIQGENKTAANSGITVSGNGQITGGTVNLTADKVNFANNSKVTGDNSTTSALKINTITANAISIGGTAGSGLHLADSLFSNVFEDFSNTVIGSSSSAGTITVNSDANTELNSDLTLNAANVNIAGTLTATGNTVTINTSGAASNNSGQISAGALNLNGANTNFTFSNTSNAVGNLAGTAKSVNFTNNSGFSTGTLTVSGVSSLTATNGNITVAETISTKGTNLLLEANDGTITNNGTINTANGNLDIKAKTGVVLSDGSKITSGSGNISFLTDSLTADGTNGYLVSGSKNLAIDTYTNIGIGLGDANAAASGSLNISQAALNAFTPGFTQITVGGANNAGINIGQATVQDNLIVTTNNNNGITFNTGAKLETADNKDLTLEAETIAFNNATLSSGKNLSLTANTFNWGNTANGLTGISTKTNGNLYIAPKTTSTSINVGGSLAGTEFRVTDYALGKIDDGNFKDVTIGQNSAGTTTAGAVTVDSFTFNSPSSNLIITGTGAAGFTTDANIKQTGSGYLKFDVASMNQTGTSNSFKFAVDNLWLKGAGAFNLDNGYGNDIGYLAADVGSLNLVNSGNRLDVQTIGTQNGITATGAIKFITDSLTATKPVKAGSTLTISPYTNTYDIRINNSDTNALNLTSADAGNLTAKTIIFGDSGFKNDVYVKNTDFTSNIVISTDGNGTSTAGDGLGKVYLEGDIKINNGNNDLLINAYDLASTANISLKNFTLNIRKGLAGLGGKVTSNNGQLTVNGTGNQDVYITDTAKTGVYVILYNMLNEVVKDFGGFRIASGNDVYLEEGTLTASLLLEAAKDINVTGNVEIAGDNSYVRTTAGGNVTIEAGNSLNITGNGAQVEVIGGDFVLESGNASKNGGSVNVTNSGAIITVNANKNFVMGDKSKLDAGLDATVKITAASTSLGTTAELDVGAGSFTLSTDTLTADSSAKITGEGSLTLQQKTGSKTLYVGSSPSSADSSSGLVITSAQLDGGLFGKDFKELTLGNINGTGTVTIDGLNLDNSVTIQTGSSGAINIGTGGLTVNDTTGDRTVTLRGGTIANGSGNIIDAKKGTINFYANTLDLTSTGTGADTVKGSGTIGLGTWNGTRDIYLGEATGTGLELSNEFFSTVLSSDFKHYNIGNSSQKNIIVNDSTLSRDTTLTAETISFKGNMNVGNLTDNQKTLTLNALKESTQDAGVITTANLLLNTGNYDLTKSDNKIGILAANANQVKVKADTLTIGSVDGVEGITAIGSGILGGDEGDDAIYIHTTNTTAASALTVNKNITANRGNITLISDTMSFDDSVRVTGPDSGTGNLTVYQHSIGASMGIGNGAAGKLQLDGRFFNDPGRIFSQGFSHIYLGRKDGTGDVTLNGDLNFVDPTTIRTGVEIDQDGNSIGGGSVIVDSGAKITSQKNLEFMTWKFRTKSGYKIYTYKDLTLTVDNLDLALDQNAISGEGNLILQTYNINRDLYLNSSGGDGLWLKSGYFDGTGGVNKVFSFNSDSSKIIIGQEYGTGKLYQSGTSHFQNEVIIRQSAHNSSGGVWVEGEIDTGGKDFSVESQNVNIHAQINTGAGNISLSADKLDISEESTLETKGDLLFRTYSWDTMITFDDSYAAQDGYLVLNKEWFTNGTIKDGAASITLSSGGDVDASGLELTDGLTGKLVLESGAGDIIIDGLNTADVTLDMSAKGKISGEDTQLKNLGDINAEKEIYIKNLGDLNINGAVSGDSVDVTANGGDLTIGVDGGVTSKKNIYLTANEKDGKGGRFINNNERASDYVLNAGGRWIIFSYDSIGDKYGKLENDFRRYGTTYDDKNLLVNGKYDYSGNGFAHAYQPTATIYSYKDYGDSYGYFFTADGRLEFTISDEDKRWLIDGGYWDSVETDKFSSYSFDDNLLANTLNSNCRPIFDNNGNITGWTLLDRASYYGSAYGESTVDFGASYTNANALNYKFDIQLEVRQKKVTVEAEDVTRTYDGTSNGNNDGVSYSGFVLDQNKDTAGINGQIAYDSNSQQAKNAGTYALDIKGSDLSSQNYYFEYVDGALEIEKRQVLVTADNDRKTYDGEAYTKGTLIYSGIEGDTDTGFVSGEDEENIGLSGSVNYASGAGNSEGAKNVGTYNININNADSNLDAQNYTFTYANGTLIVDKAHVTVTADSLEKTYNGVTYNGGTVSYDGFVTGENISNISGLSGNVNFAGSSQGKKDAGVYDININNPGSNLDAQNYDFTYVDGTLKINKKEVTVTADSDSKTYDGNSYSINSNGYSYDGFISGETAGNVNLTGGVNLNGSAKNAVNAGNYDIDISGTLAAQNYTFAYEKGTLIVEKRQVQVTADNDQKTYDGVAYSGGNGITYGKVKDGQGNELANTGFVYSDDETTIGLSGNVNYASGAGNSKGAVDVGNYDININDNSNLTSTNYDFVYVDGKLTIDQRKVTITTGDTSKTYGDVNPSFNGFTAEKAQTGSNTGLVGTDDIESVTNIYLGIDETTDAGQYSGVIQSTDLILSSGKASNYTFEVVNGNLTIDKANLTITADDIRRAQNTENPAFTVKYLGFKNTDNANSLTGLIINSSANKASQAGNYAIVPSGAWSNNYEIVYVPGQLTIYPVGAVDDVQTILSGNQNALNNPASESNNLNNQTNWPNPGDTSDGLNFDPPTPNNQPSYTPDVPQHANAVITSASNGSISQSTFVMEGSGFTLHLGNITGSNEGDHAQSKTSGAIPILFAKDGEQKLDGIYTINYNPDKLAVLPAAQGVTIPSLNEVGPEVNKDFTINYQSTEAGAFEVSYGNGIVTIHPLDDKALATLSADDKTASKAILANGILLAIEDIGIVPEQIRAVYLFLEQK